MQTCAVCHHQTTDEQSNCTHCGADLTVDSERARALARMRANPRVTKVTLAVYNTACPRCLELQGTYAKDAAPSLPVRGCSSPNGCTCMYLPVLAEIFP